MSDPKGGNSPELVKMKLVEAVVKMVGMADLGNCYGMSGGIEFSNGEVWEITFKRTDTPTVGVPFNYRGNLN